VAEQTEEKQKAAPSSSEPPKEAGEEGTQREAGEGVLPRRKLSWRRLEPYLVGLAGGLIFLGLWQGLAMTRAVPYLPSFTDSLAALVELAVEHGLALDVANSVGRIGVGFAAALVTGIPLGVAIGRWRIAHHFSKPVIEALRFIPPLAMLPVALVIFRVEATAIFIIWFAAFFPVLLSTVDGVQRTEPVHVEVARSFGATEWQVLEKVVLPSALPEILTGGRVGLGVGWMSLVAAEMVAAGAGTGLGYLIIYWGLNLGRYDTMVGVILLLAAIGFAMNEGFVLLERRLLRYRRNMTH